MGDFQLLSLMVVYPIIYRLSSILLVVQDRWPIHSMAT